MVKVLQMKLIDQMKFYFDQFSDLANPEMIAFEHANKKLKKMQKKKK